MMEIAKVRSKCGKNRGRGVGKMQMF